MWPELTWAQKSALLNERFPSMVGSLVLIIVISARSHSPTAVLVTWPAGLILFLATVNFLVRLITKHRKGLLARRTADEA
jgi:hypothetical protein